MKSSKRITIKKRIAFIVVVDTLLIVFGSWMISKYLMRSVFENRTRNELVRLYNRCDEAFINRNNESGNDENALVQIENPHGMVVVVYNPEKKEYYTAINDKGLMMKNLEDIIDGFHDNEVDEYLQAGSYKIKSRYVDELDAHYMDLIGTLNNGYLIAARAPMERINDMLESVSNVFILIAFILSIFGIIYTVGVSGLFINRINRLSRVAKKIANLDFDEKIPVKTKDEIGELGECMNLMSDQLEDSITKLKSANLQLEHDIKEKEKIDLMRTEFLSNVSHELKTPIALIQGYSEGLKDNILDDPESIEFYTDVIIDEANKMNNLVKRLLNLNEIVFGNNRLNIERFELNSFVEAVVNSYKLLIDEKKSNIVFDFEKTPCYVWADEFMIEDAFKNYLTNAIHYVVEGGTIKISTRLQNGNVRLTVYNDGNTIPEDEIPKLFDKFYKVDKARTREYGGNGIGLSIVAAALDAHGKEYGVYNEVNGVTFYFDLDAKCLEE